MEFSLSRSCFREISALLSRSLSISSLLCLLIFVQSFEHELLELDRSTRLDIRVNNEMATAVGKLEQTLLELLETRCSYLRSPKDCHGFSQLKNHRSRRTHQTAMTPSPTRFTLLIQGSLLSMGTQTVLEKILWNADIECRKLSLILRCFMQSSSGLNMGMNFRGQV